MRGTPRTDPGVRNYRTGILLGSDAQATAFLIADMAGEHSARESSDRRCVSSALPVDAASLAAPVENLEPHPYNQVTETSQIAVVVFHPVVVDMSLHYPAQPLADVPDLPVCAGSQPGLDLFELGPQPFGRGMTENPKASFGVLPTDVGEPRELEGLRAPLPALSAGLGRKSTETDGAGLLLVE